MGEKKVEKIGGGGEDKVRMGRVEVEKWRESAAKIGIMCCIKESRHVNMEQTHAYLFEF